MTKIRKEFRHPVLQMMGISRLRVPSRNWLIFWGVTGTLVGSYYLDRRQRQLIRESYIKQVEYLGKQTLQPLGGFQKVKVYVAPPPNDFLDPSLSEFRNYIKPILNAAAIDHELITEERQGYIRSTIAEEIRQLRKSQNENSDINPTGESNEDNNREYTGTLIIGRGAFKEYINGIQEGWLGPIERPAEVQEKVDAAAAVEKERLRKRHEKNAEDTEGKDQMKYDTEKEYEEDKLATLHRKYPVVPAYINAKDLSEAELPELFESTPQMPIQVYRLPHLLGILSVPTRIYRWLNERYLADEIGQQTVNVIFNKKRPFELTDADLAKSDEEDWPTKFKQNGIDSNSEWMQDLVVDPRIAKHLEVFE
ncbi:Tim54 protein [Starmerella bacillaris]|uniref:Mitochondrial import inner membrane translocase subunit TIM54 n=1 Tax=Starmerella bacillaris TaxID=1247836 RepID=A0AAV5RGI6_STABA|nr:Tim54 protein [Starmerella bacillaris]